MVYVNKCGMSRFVKQLLLRSLPAISVLKTFYSELAVNWSHGLGGRNLLVEFHLQRMLSGTVMV